jgi:hypothetical protein
MAIDFLAAFLGDLSGLPYCDNSSTLVRFTVVASIGSSHIVTWLVLVIHKR